MKEHDVVRLKRGIPATAGEPGLDIGDAGTIVHIYPDGDVFEVEFVIHGKSRVVRVFEDMLVAWVH